MGSKSNFTKKYRGRLGKSLSPRLLELEKKFKENGGYFAEKKLGEIFEFEAIKQAKSQREIPTDNSENGVNYIVQSTMNNMFSRKVNRKYLIENNEPPVSGNRIVLGVTLPAVSYQPYEFGASQVITAKSDWLNEKNGLYIVSKISKLMYQFSYARKPGMQIYKDMEIILPLDKNGNIAFDYMENYIRFLEAERIEELEAERIEELEAYFLATGLKDYNLNEKEKFVLDKFAGEGLIYKKYFLKDIFESENGNFDIKKEHINGKGNFVVTAGLGNWGILGKTDVEARIFPKNTITVDMFGENFYRNFDYKMVTHARVFSLQSKENLSKNQIIFMSAILKFLNQIFGYENMCSYTKIKNFEIFLPTLGENIDFDFMENFIKAVEKLVIKDLVIWNDKKLQAYREIVGKI